MARSSSTCVALVGFGSTDRLTVGTFVPKAVTSVTAGGQFVGRARASGLRPFGLFVTASPSPGSFAPNHSFKPTPSRGFVETRGSPRNTGSRLPRSARLNSGVRRSKAFSGCVARNSNSLASVSCALRTRSRHVVTSASAQCALRRHMRCAHRLRKHWPAYGGHVRSRRGHFGDSRRRVREARSSIRA